MSTPEHRKAESLSGRVSDLLRLPFPFIGKGASGRAVLGDARLPPELDERIFEIVRRTRLWSTERAEVTRDLVAHAQDALDAGREPAEIAGTLGEPEQVARLITKAMKRKRHWLWHAQKRALQGLGIGVAAVLLFLGFLVARLYIGDPTPTRNFLAELNAAHEHLSEDEKAWPVYERAQIAIYDAEQAARPAMEARARPLRDAPTETGDPAHEQPGIDLRHKITPTHPDYPAMLELLERIQPQLAEVRRAAAMPAAGLLYSDRYDEEPPDPDVTAWWAPKPLPPSDDPAEQGLLVGVLLPHLGVMRNHARWLAFDARVAAAQDDADRAHKSLLSILRIAQQPSEEPFIISQLVGVAIAALGVQEMNSILHQHPDVFSRAQLVELAHELATASDCTLALSLNGERMWMQDYLQRAFTDDGNGNGRITNEGIRITRDVEALSEGSGFEDAAFAATMLRLATRQELLAAYDRFVSRGEAALRNPYREPDWSLDADIETVNDDRPDLSPAIVFMPAMGNLVKTVIHARVRLEAAEALIAAHVFRRDAGRWPTSLDELSPRYLPIVPLDPFDLNPMKYALTDSGPVLYVLGADRDDDGGRRPAEDSEGNVTEVRPAQAVQAPDGDWVLYPPAE